MKRSRKIELLAPAADFSCGCAAILAGADALYVGGPAFSARSSACNSVADIGRLVAFAGAFGARVYLALNTMFADDSELSAARALALECVAVGVSGVIFQDVRVLAMGLPVELHASTQVCMDSVERAVEFAQSGVNRIVLERGLSLSQIAEIGAAVGDRVELEAFVHGAICVGCSGVCYLSEHLASRSGNRGECAQPCRSRYDLVGPGGEVLIQGRELLSPADLNLSGRLRDLVDAGVMSLKIEGRLKGADYVSNVVAYYNALLEDLGAQRTSWGRSRPVGYRPSLSMSFNRGFTEWFLDGPKAQRGARSAQPGGHFVGTVSRVINPRMIEVELHRQEDGQSAQISNGDGLVYSLASGQSIGFRVNRVEQIGVRCTLHLQADSTLRGGERLFCNSTQGFKPQNTRQIEVSLVVQQGRVVACDAYGHSAEVTWGDAEVAQNQQRAMDMMRQGLSKSGGTNFEVVGVEFECTELPHLPNSGLNALRRELLEKLAVACISDTSHHAPYPQITPTHHTPQNINGEWLMRTPYCILGENGMCRKGQCTEGYTLHNNGRSLSLHFDCTRCQMTINRP